jgi:hypothetical protein
MSTTDSSESPAVVSRRKPNERLLRLRCSAAVARPYVPCCATGVMAPDGDRCPDSCVRAGRTLTSMSDWMTPLNNHD